MIKSLLLTQLAIYITNGPQNTDGMRITLYSDLIKNKRTEKYQQQYGRDTYTSGIFTFFVVNLQIY